MNSISISYTPKIERLFDKHGNELSVAQAMSISPVVLLDEVTRVEVIDSKGRSYVNYPSKVEISMQDENRTLKIFVGDGENEK